ncbi:MAG: adenylyl-sulfate kinase [Alphaproteobacteria bacterium]|nr:adenylyl-sulfate kinase [Alphaproteobacteria bacterium]
MTDDAAARQQASTSQPLGEAIRPLRIVMAGADGAGKTALADRLASLSAGGKFTIADVLSTGGGTAGLLAGAADADAAVVLIDARKGMDAQIYLQSHIAVRFGATLLVPVVSKMDLIEFDQARFDTIAQSYAAFAEALDIGVTAAVPVSALCGENIADGASSMPWYAGPTLLSLLEGIDVATDRETAPLRMPIQRVDSAGRGARGCFGAIATGTASVGMTVGVYPGGQTAKLDRIVGSSGEIGTAEAGDTVTLQVGSPIDVKPGDMLADAAAPPECADQIAADIVWLSPEPMVPGRTYDIRIGAQAATGSITELKYRLNPVTGGERAAKLLNRDEVGFCNLAFNRIVAFDSPAAFRATRRLELRDPSGGEAVGVGVIRFGLRRASNLRWQSLDVDRQTRASLKDQRPTVLWFTGLSGAGKSTVANLVEKQLVAEGRHTYVLDGDNVRHGLNRDLGFTEVDRVENLRRVGEVSRLMVDAGLIVIVAAISPFESERQTTRALFEAGEFVEIFMDTPIEICEQRDTKGLYRKARAGRLKNFTGIDSPYEPPSDPEIRLRPEDGPPDSQAAIVMAYLKRIAAIR